MTTLRRRSFRALQTLLSVAVPALVLTVFALATVQPGVADPGDRSHARRAYSAALPAPSFASAGAPHGGKHRKGNSAAHGASSAHRAAPAASGRRGHGHQPTPTDDRPALWRADRRHPGYADEPFAVARGVRSARFGHGTVRIAQRDTRHGNRILVGTLRSRRGASRYTDYSSRYTAPPVVAASSVPAHAPPSASSQPYATGVAQPDSYDSMSAAVPASGAAAIGTALVMTSPSTPGRPVQSNSTTMQVVSGFGGEVALSGPDTGGTRRRNHPVSATGLPGFAPPPPANLAERNAITMVAVSPAILPDIYDHSGRLVTVAPLKGSHEVLVHQNTMATADGLGRIQDEIELDRLRSTRDLVDFPETNSLHMNPSLPYDRRCARPWTVLFAVDIAHDFFERFHEPLYVTSAVRTVSFQMRLQRVNGNAAAIDGDAASPHLTGQALDFGKRGMSSAELAWMRSYLTPLIESGRIDVEEEFQQACFHISVYRRYAATRGSAQVVAQMQPGAAPAGPINPQP